MQQKQQLEQSIKQYEDIKKQSKDEYDAKVNKYNQDVAAYNQAKQEWDAKKAELESKKTEEGQLTETLAQNLLFLKMSLMQRYRLVVTSEDIGSVQIIDMEMTMEMSIISLKVEIH